MTDIDFQVEYVPDGLLVTFHGDTSTEDQDRIIDQFQASNPGLRYVQYCYDASLREQVLLTETCQ